jgi:hypothetical protein
MGGIAVKTYDRTWLKAAVAEDRKRIARYGVFTGVGDRENARYLDRGRAYHATSGTVLCFTRDTGHHTSGWWKSPDFESCLHLSLSFRDPDTRQVAPRDKALTKEWVGLFFGNDAAKLWCEPPYSAEGKRLEVWHYRLFCHTPGWHPIVPRGEVYSRELTEAGWLSYSDVQAKLAEELEGQRERSEERR